MSGSLRGMCAALAVVALAAACSPADAPIAAPATATDTDAISFGSFLPITGPYSEIGQSDLAAQEMAVAELNAAGGVLGRKVTLKSIDGGCDPEQTVAAVQQLVRAKVNATVGGICSASLTNAMPILRAANMVHVEPGANSTDLLKDPYGGLFLLIGTVADEAKAASPWLTKLGVRHPMIVHDGTSFALTLAQSARSEFATTDHPALNLLGLTQGARTYAPLVKKIMKSTADAVLYTGYYAEAAVLITDLRKAGFTGKIILGDGAADLAIQQGVTSKHLKNVFFITPPLPQGSAPAQEWAQKYRKFNGEEPRAFSMQSYTAVMAVADAIERAGSTDSTQIADALRSTTFAAPYGTLGFDERQVAATGFSFVTISGGQFTAACSPSCH